MPHKACHITPDVCGLELVFRNCKDAHDFLLLHGIDFSGFHLFVEAVLADSKSAETLSPGKVEQAHLAERMKNGASFMELILTVYPKNTLPYPIETYQKYKASQCERILLLYDMVNIEVYAKKQDWLKQLLLNAGTQNTAEIRLKTEETDGRTGMYV